MIITDLTQEKKKKIMYAHIWNLNFHMQHLEDNPAINSQLWEKDASECQQLCAEQMVMLHGNNTEDTVFHKSRFLSLCFTSSLKAHLRTCKTFWLLSLCDNFCLKSPK